MNTTKTDRFSWLRVLTVVAVATCGYEANTTPVYLREDAESRRDNDAVGKRVADLNAANEAKLRAMGLEVAGR